MAGTKFYLMKKSDFAGFIDSLLKEFAVFAPAKRKGEWNFERVESGGEIVLEGYVNTEFPPKRFLLPEGEVLFEYGKGGEVKAKTEKEKAVIFGVRPCDTHGFVVLDRVMLSEPADMHYKARRDSTLVLALNCEKAGENCFCGSMGTDRAEGFDLLFTDQGKEYHVEVGSDRGFELVRKSRLFRATDKEAERKELAFKKKIETENLTEIMKGSFGSRIWDSISERCLSCASCTSVCPTCYCFNLPHLSSLENGGKIVREWSYCMLKPFTKVAGDLYFRESRIERVKQFFYHKLVYGKENQGKFHCVGCGRCITECPTHINITEEAEKVRKEYEKGKLRP